jgi:hypothetical protein
MFQLDPFLSQLVQIDFANFAAFVEGKNTAKNDLDARNMAKK